MGHTNDCSVDLEAQSLEVDRKLYLQHSLGEVSVEEPNHLLHIGAALGSNSDHIAVSKPGTWL